MPVHDLSPVGAPCWIDLFTSDTDGARAFYAELFGWTLARAHGRSGDAVAIAEYLGDHEAFDTSITEFSQRYADQNERDYEAFVAAIRSGRVPAVEGI